MIAARIASLALLVLCFAAVLRALVDVGGQLLGNWTRRALAGVGYGDIVEGPQE